MEVIKEISDIYMLSQKHRQKGETVGLVPTMGYLHGGHTSLIKRSVQDCTKTVVSIFVNPSQFGPGEDFEKYPRDPERDIKILAKTGTDYVFAPSTGQMYEDDNRTIVKVDKLDKVMCGKFRPGHFSGVCTVVLKLLNIVNPHNAYFGQKDFQQLVIIKQMVKDLNVPARIVSCPTIREKDGLALSSRNRYLSEDERKNAAILFKSLSKAAEMVKKEGSNTKEIKKEMMENILKNKFVSKVDYFDLRKTENLEEIRDLKQFRQNIKYGNILIAAAIWIGTTRLIDNVVV